MSTENKTLIREKIIIEDSKSSKINGLLTRYIRYNSI